MSDETLDNILFLKSAKFLDGWSGPLYSVSVV